MSADGNGVGARGKRGDHVGFALDKPARDNLDVERRVRARKRAISLHRTPGISSAQSGREADTLSNAVCTDSESMRKNRCTVPSPRPFAAAIKEFFVLMTPSAPRRERTSSPTLSLPSPSHVSACTNTCLPRFSASILPQRQKIALDDEYGLRAAFKRRGVFFRAAAPAAMTGLISNRIISPLRAPFPSFGAWHARTRSFREPKVCGAFPPVYGR